MQLTPASQLTRDGRFGRNLGYLLLPPVITLALLLLALAVAMATYQSRHNGRILTGVSVMGIDLSQKSPADAAAALADAFPYPQAAAIVLADPASGRRWQRSPADLGLHYDIDQTVAAAYDVGRRGGPLAALRGTFQSWYYGVELPPVLVLDESQLNQNLAELAAEVDQPAVSAALSLNGNAADYAPGRPGRQLDIGDTRARLLQPLTTFRPAELQLLVHNVTPAVNDAGAAATEIERLIHYPITFYLQNPLDETDLAPVTLPPADLASWVRADVTADENGGLRHHAFVDENALRHWLSQFADTIAREPVNARYYFDDDTRELVLVAPHVNGRELDLDATIARFMAHVGTPNRSVPFMVREITPEANAEATAADLGITELITETTTWFSGSSDARKHNIATAAANFYGIVVAPYEEFSFIKYLGSISEADGYTEGLIIVGGQTIAGVGGGICQVSTTLYQTAFFAGFPIVERLPHGYMLGYYRDGAGHGMDATVYSPIVDMKFINNTPHYLLIENYYNEENESLTFKFYSTSLGRTVVKSGPVFSNETAVPGPDQDKWVFREDLPAGTVEQIDWATEGADVTVTRTVYNANGEKLYGDELFSSHYIPVPNVFHYGPGVEPYDYSLVPEDDK